MFNQLFANCLLVNNFQKSLDFYQNILDLPLNSQDGKFADFKLNGTLLAIFEKEAAVAMLPSKYMKSGGGVVLAFQVNNVAESSHQLQTKGVSLIEGPKTTDWGQTVAYFLDPDNNIWEISQK